MTINPDALAQFIRQIDGNNSMGAGVPVSYTHLTLPTICSV